MPEAIFFDWDGTLVDSMGLLRRAHGHVCEKMGLPPLDERTFLSWVRLSARDLFPMVFGDRADEAQGFFYDYVGAHDSDVPVFFDDAPEVLAVLHARGIPLGVVSNKRHDLLGREIASLGWNDFFGVWVGAGRADRDKPAPDPLLLAIAEAGKSSVDPQEIWFVGDTQTDCECARAAGVRYLHVGSHPVGLEESVSRKMSRLREILIL